MQRSNIKNVKHILWCYNVLLFPDNLKPRPKSTPNKGHQSGGSHRGGGGRGGGRGGHMGGGRQNMGGGMRSPLMGQGPMSLMDMGMGKYLLKKVHP